MPRRLACDCCMYVSVLHPVATLGQTECKFAMHTTNDSTLHPKPTLSLQAEETNPKEDLQHQNDARAQTPRVLCTYMVECRVSKLGITIMSWGSICHNRTWDPLGYNGPIITLNSTYSLHCSSFSWFKPIL